VLATISLAALEMYESLQEYAGSIVTPEEVLSTIPECSTTAKLPVKPSFKLARTLLMLEILNSDAHTPSRLLLHSPLLQLLATAAIHTFSYVLVNPEAWVVMS
jgi:hypothetical protein